MKRLIILGAGGHGAVVAEAARLMNRWNDILFLDDDENASQEVLGCPIIGKFEQLRKLSGNGTELIVAVGDNLRRSELIGTVKNEGGQLATVIHPSAEISESASIADGVMVGAGCVIGARAMIGEGSIINTSATVDHDCNLGVAVHLSPGANLGGGAVIGDLVWVGIGATVNGFVSIGSASIVGASAAVISDVVAGQTVVGVPAKPVAK